jgi:hypothetical protein
MNKLGISSFVSENEEQDPVNGIKHVWLEMIV